MRRALLWLGLLLALGVPNGLIVRQEYLVRRSRPVFMELAPADPRSRMQGDYMRLDYALLRGDVPGPEPRLEVDGRGVVTSLRGTGPVLRLGKGDWNQWIIPGAENYFFQEGRAGEFERARYAELRLTPEGRALLVGLRDERLNPLE